MNKISLTDKYRGLDIKKVAKNCERACGLYEGNYVVVGPEEGAPNPTIEGRDRAIEMVKLLYPQIEPYKEQIRSDYRDYLQLDWWERDRVYEDGWVLVWLDWACEFFDTYIGFIDELRDSQQPQQASTVMGPQQKTKRGRQVGPFRSVLIGTDETLKECRLQRLHKVADGRRGKEFAKLILVAISEGWITKPTYSQVVKEFGDIGCNTGYNRYLAETMHTKAEILGAKNALNG